MTVIKRAALLGLALIAIWWFVMPVRAGGDAVWVAQMEEDEGGPVMVASVTLPVENSTIPALLRLMCGDGKVALRFEPGGDKQGQPGDEADFVFETEGGKLTRSLAYEDMDGAFAAYGAENDALVALLRDGQNVTVSDAGGEFVARRFSLSGSGAAIATLLKSCS